MMKCIKALLYTPVTVYLVVVALKLIYQNHHYKFYTCKRALPRRTWRQRELFISLSGFYHSFNHWQEVNHPELMFWSCVFCFQCAETSTRLKRLLSCVELFISWLIHTHSTLQEIVDLLFWLKERLFNSMVLKCKADFPDLNQSWFWWTDIDS